MIATVIAVLTAVGAGVGAAAIAFLFMLWFGGQVFSAEEGLGVVWFAAVGALLIGLVAGLAVLLGMLL